jgi:hypothetical protein
VESRAPSDAVIQISSRSHRRERLELDRAGSRRGERRGRPPASFRSMSPSAGARRRRLRSASSPRPSRRGSTRRQ